MRIVTDPAASSKFHAASGSRPSFSAILGHIMDLEHSAKGTKTAILIDFDGTATLDDNQDLIFRAFAPPEWEAIDEQWMQGKLSTMEEFAWIFPRMKASQREIEACLDGSRLDPGFVPLVEHARTKGYAFAILSDGLQWVIEYVTRRAGMERLVIYANQILFKKDGYELSYPWYDPSTPLRGTGKCAIIRRYQAQGYRVVFIGDGVSDVEAAQAADVACARGRLVELCRKANIPAIRFDRLTGLLEQLKAKSL